MALRKFRDASRRLRVPDQSAPTSPPADTGILYHPPAGHAPPGCHLAHPPPEHDKPIPAVSNGALVPTSETHNIYKVPIVDNPRF